MITATRLVLISKVLNTETLVLANGEFTQADKFTPSSFTIALNLAITAQGYCQILAQAVGSNSAAIARYY